MMIGTVLCGADAAADLHAVDLGHHEVEDDEVEALALEGVDRLLAVARLHDLVALLLEREAQELLDRLFVVGEQDLGAAGGHLASSRPALRASGSSRASRAPAAPRRRPRRHERPHAERGADRRRDVATTLEIGLGQVDRGHRRRDAVLDALPRKTYHRPVGLAEDGPAEQVVGLGVGRVEAHGGRVQADARQLRHDLDVGVEEPSVAVGHEARGGCGGP